MSQSGRYHFTDIISKSAHRPLSSGRSGLAPPSNLTVAAFALLTPAGVVSCPTRLSSSWWWWPHTMSKEQRNEATALLSPAGETNVQVSQKRLKYKMSVSCPSIKPGHFLPSSLFLKSHCLSSYIQLKIPSEMEVAPRYKLLVCWHCWHYWNCFSLLKH